MKLSLVLLLSTALFAAQSPLAQQLVTTVMAAHPELQKMGLHAIPPGQRDDVVIACSVPTKIGKLSSPGDLAVEQSGQPTVRKVDQGAFYDLALPLSDATGKRIGMVVMEMRFSGAQNAQEALQKATAIRDHLQAAIPTLGSLFGSDAQPLTLVHTTSLPEITGDFDHFAVDLARNRLFVSAEEHHSIEVFDLKTGDHLASAGSVTTPHTIAFVPERDELLVADGGDSSVRILSGENLSPAARLPVEPGPDAAFYDATNRLFYVGNGGRKANQPYSFLSVVSGDDHKELRKIRI